jgi:hypothetical protein
MRPRTYFSIVSTLFAVVAAAHVVRLLMGWNISIDGWAAPQWISVVGVLVPGALSAWGLTLLARARTL